MENKEERRKHIARGKISLVKPPTQSFALLHCFDLLPRKEKKKKSGLDIYITKRDRDGGDLSKYT